MSEPYVRPRALSPDPPPQWCPWCGNHETCIRWDRSILTEGVTYHVRCYICNARGPSNYSVDYAVKRWNQIHEEHTELLSGMLRAESALREAVRRLRRLEGDDEQES